MSALTEYGLTIEFYTNDSDELEDKIIYINLEEYQRSYEADIFHLRQQYTDSVVESYVRPVKEEYLVKCIDKYLSSNDKLDSDIDSLIDELDEYISEINEEGSGEYDDGFE